MRFLVTVEVQLPHHLSEAERAELLARGRARGRELKEEGWIQDMWRLPGRIANVGIWQAESATALHEAVASLPLFAWARVDVVALADHPLTAHR